MKNELTSTFEQVYYQIWNLNKNNLIRVYLVLDDKNNFKKEYLLWLKNHELKYAIISKVIDDLESMQKVIKESVKISNEKDWIWF